MSTLTGDRSPALPVVIGCGAAALATALAGAISLIDAIVVLGVAAVLPLALGGPLWWWEAAAGAALVSFLLPAGWAAFLGLPAVAAVAATLVAGCIRNGPLLFWRPADTLHGLAGVYALVAAGALVCSRAGLRAFGIDEPIVELTAVHYIYAGAAALVLAARTLDTGSGLCRRVGRAAVACTAAAPPVVAIGFITHSAIPQVGGAVLMATGVCLTAAVQLRAARRSASAAVTVLLSVSGLAVWAPMVLAVAWAAGQYWAVPILSIPDMARTHGLVNALAFVLCGLLGRTAESPAPVVSSREVAA